MDIEDDVVDTAEYSLGEWTTVSGDQCKTCGVADFIW